MNFGGPPKPPRMDGPPPPADEEAGSRQRSAAPPPCPRCELVKSQVNDCKISYQILHLQPLLHGSRFSRCRDGPDAAVSTTPSPQAAKTILNYQRSHRKKLDALRAELKSSRRQVESLQGQLRGYRTATKVIPGLALLSGVAWLVVRIVRRKGRAPERAEAAPAAEPGTPEAKEQQQPAAAEDA